MGSRALVCRDEETATAMPSSKLSDAAARSLFETLQSDWLLLDCEVKLVAMPVEPNAGAYVAGLIR